MSVQVRRRCEAAAFLQTYVGAQAELIVDTTNNRVQVHDGTTAGGWPAARLADLAGRNLILNGNFGVNQRGYATGTALAAGAFGHDRWRDTGSGGTAYTFTQGTPDTQITLTAGSLCQPIEGANVEGGAYTLSWAGTSACSVSYTNAQGTSVQVTGSSPLAVPSVAPGTTIYVIAGVGTLGLVQLEPGATSTPYRRLPLTTAIANCQRYFWLSAALPGVVGNTGSGTASVIFPVTMRTTPTVTLVNGSVNGGSALEVFTAQHVVSGLVGGTLNTNGGRFDMNFGTAFGAAQRPFILEAGSVSFSAEL